MKRRYFLSSDLDDLDQFEGELRSAGFVNPQMHVVSRDDAGISGVTATVGWVPFLFLAIVVLGFCTWEGGLFGIQEPNNEFLRFDRDLKAGRHLFVLDMTTDQDDALSQVLQRHPRVEAAGEGTAAPEFVVQAQKKFNDAMQTLP